MKNISLSLTYYLCVYVAIKHADWNASKIREKLCHDTEAHAASVRGVKLSELKSSYEKKITEALVQPVESLFDSAAQDIWASIRKLYRHETENAISRYSSSLTGFELDQSTFDKMMADLKNYARGVVVRKIREEAGKVLIHMKDRFSTVFSHDKYSMPRVWTGKEDVRKITEEARAVALKLLAAMAAIRLDDQSDKIENILSSSLMDGPVIKNRTIEASRDPLASSTWEGVAPENTVITPVQCKSIWKQFKVETEYIVSEAISSQEAFKHRNSWLPPPWAIVTIAILGFNEFMMLLRNPLYLVILFILFILSRVVWYELNIAGEFQNGTLSGLLAISTRFLPSVLNILRRVAGEGNRHHQAAQSSQQALPSPAHTPRNQMQRRFSSSSFSSSNTKILRHSDAGPSSESVAESKSSPICH
ncbi:hypothetical protein B296_00006579 [Ensete ventricosum]|uniref:Sey1/RHD3-like three-helix bundle domain-containing protein n=1 Tax=Ensete ventricosum TaxID=4639 RepID=A0A426ZQE9_ENSVE|nr:hypothetical protein B296_00006579 [Ensete ventricosum]